MRNLPTKTREHSSQFGYRLMPPTAILYNIKSKARLKNEAGFHGLLTSRLVIFDDQLWANRYNRRVPAVEFQEIGDIVIVIIQAEAQT